MAQDGLGQPSRKAVSLCSALPVTGQEVGSLGAQGNQGARCPWLPAAGTVTRVHEAALCSEHSHVHLLHPRHLGVCKAIHSPYFTGEETEAWVVRLTQGHTERQGRART